MIKFAILIKSPDQLGRYENLTEALCKRGHQAEVFFDRPSTPGDELDYGWTLYRKDFWAGILSFTRDLLTHRRYLKAEGQSLYYRKRHLDLIPFWQRVFLKIPGAGLLLKTEAAFFLLSRIENMAPPCKEIVEQLKNSGVKAVIVQIGMRLYKLVGVEYLKAARHLGIKSFVSVATWDNLTTKGFIQIIPDAVFVWNDYQKRECREHHGVPENKIHVVGSPLFDYWFSDFKPSVSSESFSANYGLKPQNPFIVYLGSSAQIAKDESGLIQKFREDLDKADDESLKNIQIVVRPHPSNYKHYQCLKGVPGIFLIPEKGAVPFGATEAAQLFYDTMYYSICGVGINTSAMIETIIFGKPVIAVIDKKYEKTQSETQHFRHLLAFDVLELANSNEELLRILKNLVSGNDARAQKRLRFLKSFIRPRGLDIPASDLLAQKAEEIIQSG